MLQCLLEVQKKKKSGEMNLSLPDMYIVPSTDYKIPSKHLNA